MFCSYYAHSAVSLRNGVSYKPKYVQEVLVNCVTDWHIVTPSLFSDLLVTLSSRNVVTMVAEAANKLSLCEVTGRSQALWHRGFGLGLRLFKVNLGSAFKAFRIWSKIFGRSFFT